MKRFLNLIFLACFCLWIIPLGVFIKPDNEKETCGGQRAICLCSHGVEKSPSSHSPKMALANHGGVDKEQAPSGGHGEFVLSSRHLQDPFNRFFFLIHSTHPHALLLCKSITHVPKV